jgi:hypothetical protein
LNGKVEWISEEACSRYVDCLVLYTSQGIQHVEAIEEEEQSVGNEKSLDLESENHEDMEVQTEPVQKAELASTSTSM